MESKKSKGKNNREGDEPKRCIKYIASKVKKKIGRRRQVQSGSLVEKVPGDGDHDDHL